MVKWTVLTADFLCLALCVALCSGISARADAATTTDGHFVDVTEVIAREEFDLMADHIYAKGQMEMISQLFGEVPTLYLKDGAIQACYYEGERIGSPRNDITLTLDPGAHDLGDDMIRVSLVCYPEGSGGHPDYIEGHVYAQIDLGTTYEPKNLAAYVHELVKAEMERTPLPENFSRENYPHLSEKTRFAEPPERRA